MKTSQQHFKPDLLQPLRAKDSAKHDKRADRPAPNTPDFDKKKKIAAATPSPLPRAPEKENRSISKQAPGLHTSACAETAGTRSSGQKPGTKARAKADDKKVLVLEASEATDHSFEEEEKRIRRESLVRDFLLTLVKKDAALQEEAQRYLWDYLKKNSKVHDVHLTYADELREVNLKKKLLSNFRIAADNHKFRFKLVRNFARIFNRLLKKPLDEALAHAFREAKLVKRQLHRPSPRPTKKPVKSPPKSHAAFKSQAPTPTETTTLSASNAEIKRPTASKTPKIKKEDFSKKDVATPVKGTPVAKPLPKQAKPDPKEKAQQRAEILRSSGKKKGVLNSSLDDHLYRSKRGHASLDSSAEKNLRTSIEVGSLVSKPEIAKKASLPKLLDNSKHIVIKHQEVKDEIKKRLLQQVHSGGADEEEDADAEYESRRTELMADLKDASKRIEGPGLDEELYGRKLAGTPGSRSYPRNPVPARLGRAPLAAQPRPRRRLQKSEPEPERRFGEPAPPTRPELRALEHEAAVPGRDPGSEGEVRGGDVAGRPGGARRAEHLLPLDIGPPAAGARGALGGRRPEAGAEAVQAGLPQAVPEQSVPCADAA